MQDNPDANLLMICTSMHVCHKLTNAFDNDKLYMSFEIITDYPYKGEIISRYYNVTKYESGGRFRSNATGRSACVRV